LRQFQRQLSACYHHSAAGFFILASRASGSYEIFGYL
jgi:hypothetical protein